MGRGRGQPHLQLPVSFGKMGDEFTGHWVCLRENDNEGESIGHEVVEAASGPRVCIGFRDCISSLGLP